MKVIDLRKMYTKFYFGYSWLPSRMEKQDVSGAKEKVESIYENVGPIESAYVVPFEHNKALHQRMF